MPDYIPRKDADFSTWVRELLAGATEHMAELDLTPEDIAPLANAVDAWCSAYTGHIAAQAAAEGARAAKDGRRADVQREVRALIRVAHHGARSLGPVGARLGLPERDLHATRVQVPTTFPAGRVDFGQAWRHTLHFWDGSSGRRGKPHGVTGCEVWVVLGGEPSVDPREARFLGLATRTPFVVDYKGADVGKTAHYVLRWQNTRGEPGPWSDTLSAVIAR